MENFITEKFEPFGTIKSRGVFKDNKLDKFYAFVAFENIESAKEA